MPSGDEGAPVWIHESLLRRDEDPSRHDDETSWPALVRTVTGLSRLISRRERGSIISCIDYGLRCCTWQDPTRTAAESNYEAVDSSKRVLFKIRLSPKRQVLAFILKLHLKLLDTSYTSNTSLPPGSLIWEA
jgi:hypothetical protein